MRIKRYMLSLILSLVALMPAGAQAVVVDPSQIAASAVNAAEQFDYLLDQLGELSEMGNQMSTVKKYIDGIFGENGVGGKAIDLLQDLGTLDRLTQSYNMTITQMKMQAEMMKKMENLKFADINMLVSYLRSAKATVEMAIQTAKHIINTLGLTKKEKKDEIDSLINEMERKIDHNRIVLNVERYAAMEAQALDEFLEFTDRSMDVRGYRQSKEAYGTLDNAGEGVVGLIGLLLTLMGILSVAWGAVKTMQGGMEGDPVVDNMFPRIGAILVFSMIIIGVLATAFGFNI